MERVVIDVVGRFTDNITTSASGAVGVLERLAKKNIFVKFNADSSPFLKVLRKAEQQADKFGKKKLSLILQAVDQATQLMGKVWNFGLKIGGAVWKTTVTVIDKATAPIRGIFNLLKNPIFQIGATMGLSFGASNMIQTYSNFEAAMSQVQAISGANASDMTKLTEAAKEMGATTAFTATQAAEALNYMALAGYDAETSIAMLPNVLNLAAAGGINLASASDMVTDAQSALGLTLDETSQMVDQMALTSSKTNTSVAQLGEAFLTVGGTAKNLSGGVTELSAMLGVLADNGVKGAEGGTALRNIILSLSAPTDKAAATLKSLGVQAFDAKGNLRPLNETFLDLQNALQNLTQEKQTQALNSIFNKADLKSVNALLGTSAERYDELMKAIDNADGAAKRMAKTMLDNLKGSMTLLQSAAEGAIITIMEKGAPHLRSFIDWLASVMPGLGNTVANALDFIGTKIEWVHDKISEIMDSPDFKFGSIGEKIKLLWNGIVADPLSDWWNNGGREKSIEAAGAIGKELGEILKTGLLVIFGMTDALSGGNSEAMSAGASIAKSFAEGFAEGFDASLVAEKLKEAIGNIWNAMPDWGKNLTKGIVASKIVGGVSNAVLSGLTLYNGAKAFIGTSKATSESMYGSGLLGLGKKTAVAIGGLPSGTVLSAGQMSALGLGEIAGALSIGAGIVHTVSSAHKAYKSFKEGDDIGGKSNAAKAGLTASGAAIGAAIGANFFGIGAIPGALIGGGIGTIAGWLGGDKVAKNIEATRYKTEQMRNAIQDTNMSAEELAQTLNKATYADMKSRFGEIELSLSEIQRLSNQIVFGDKMGAMDEFINARQSVASSMAAFQSADADIDKWMWKASLGVKFDESEIQSIKDSFDAYINSAGEYVSNKHSEFTTAVSLLFDVETPDAQNILNSGNEYFKNVQTELTEKSDELTKTLNEYLADGKLEVRYDANGTLIDEPAVIAEMQQQIADIMKKVSDAEFEAQLDLIKLKFGNGKLSLESFDNFVAQLSTSISSSMEAGEQAYITIAAAAKLQLKDGAISLDEYNRQVMAAAKAHNVNIGELSAKVENIVLDIVGAAYPEVDKSGLKSGLQHAMSDLTKGLDPLEWSDADTAKFLNVSSLEAETAKGLREMLSGIAQMMSKFGLRISPELQIETDFSLHDKLQNSLDGIDQALQIDANVETNWEIKNVGSAEEEILALVSPDGEFVIPINAFAEANWTAGGDSLNPMLLSPEGDLKVPVSAVAMVLWSYITGQEFSPEKLVPETSDPAQTTVPVETNVVASGGDGFDSSSVTSQIPDTTESVGVTVPVEPNIVPTEADGFDSSAITSQVPSETDPVGATVPITPDFNPTGQFTFNQSTFGVVGPYSGTITVNITGEFVPANQFLFDQTEFGIVGPYPANIDINITASFYPANRFSFNQEAFGISTRPYQANATVNIKVKYNTDTSGKPNLSSIPQARGGIIGPNGPVGFATGGMVRGGPQLVTVAEEGTPEMIIPLGSQRRQRGLQLWERAGKMLGVPGFANGGLVGQLSEPDRAFEPRFVQKVEPLEYPKSTSGESVDESQDNSITVNVGGVTLQLNMGDVHSDIVAAVKERKDEIAEVIGDALKEAIAGAFANFPARGGKTA